MPRLKPANVPIRSITPPGSFSPLLVHSKPRQSRQRVFITLIYRFNSFTHWSSYDSTKQPSNQSLGEVNMRRAAEDESAESP